VTQSIEIATGGGALLRTLRATYDDRHAIRDHEHAWGQLVYAASGAVHVATPVQVWLIPPARAVWLPPHVGHSLRMKGRATLRTLYVPPDACTGLGASPKGLTVTPLMRELILVLTGFAFVDSRDPLQAALAAAFLATLAEAPTLTLVLTRPREPTALRVALSIEADPASEVPLARLAAENGTSLRTLQRRFLLETGMALSEWRQGARLIAAAASLLQGESVTSAALDAGYASTSAFITAFRSRFGQTPGAFRTGAPP
jgi:AraC-like DNA-binding protein/quercetin dioxygenase-like cupin family protein